jgi:cytochrome c biogenesis protein CcmG, thiol:disulfide interchange protein DsbE
MHRPPSYIRMLRLAAIPLIAVLLVLVLVLAVRNGAQQQAIAENVAVSTPALRPAAVVAPSSTPGQDVLSPREAPQLAGGSTIIATIIAIVNDKMIVQADLDEAAAVDRAMSALAGRDPTPVRLVLEHLVKGELVWQAAQASNAPMADGQFQLVALLATLGRTEHELDTALANEKLARAEFETQFTRLMTIDQFARDKNKRFGNSDDSYIRELQRAAHISFGPRTGEVLATALSTDPDATSSVAADRSGRASDHATAVGAPSTGGVHAAASTPTAVTARGTEPGQLAPDFQLAAANSPTDTIRLDDFLGKPLVLSFWTTWCPYCLRQTPVMVDAERRYAVDGIQFAGVDVQDPSDAVTPYLDQHGIGYPILLDQDGTVAGLYAVSGYPTTYFLDAAGRVVARHIGALSAEQMTSYAQQLLRAQ